MLQCCRFLYSLDFPAKVGSFVHTLLSQVSRTPTYRQGDPGPKSGGGLVLNRRFIRVLSWVLFLFHPVTAMHQAADVRVGGSPHLEPPEVGVNGLSNRLQGASNLNGDFLINPPPKAAHKRSFQRAQRRAVQNGCALYRGNWFSAKQLGVSPNPRTPKLSRSGPSLDMPRVPRLHFVSWNASGLTTDRHAELRTWLQQKEQQAIDIVAVQETHWRGPLEYCTAGFHALHSGGAKSEAGLLLLVNARKFPEHTIQFHDIIPGRLLHVRLESEPSTDLILVYQHAWSISRSRQVAASSKEAILAKRAQLWAHLHSLVSRTPKRNQLLLVGDFNCSLKPEGSLIGRGVHVHSQHHATDAHMLQDLVRNFGLVALNTWSKRGLAACTYHPATPKGHSQIDFALVRSAQCDQLARQTRPLHAPFVPSTGMRHWPLQGSIPVPSVPKQHRPSDKPTKRQVQEQCNKNPHVLTLFQRQLKHLNIISPHMSPDDLIVASWKQVQRETKEGIPVQGPERCADSVVSLWKQRALVRSLPRPPPGLKGSRFGLGKLFRLWRESHILQQLHTNLRLRRQCRQRKRDRINQLLAEAAAQPQSLTTVFRLIKTLAPKTPHKRLQLRAPNGCPLSTFDSLKSIQDYFHGIYHTHPAIPALSPPCLPLQLTWTELAEALAALPASKALPAAQPPAALWKAAAGTLAEKLLPKVNAWLQHMDVAPPDEWHIADIFLMLKPGKPSEPASLRPISLLHPIAKALACVLKQKLEPAAARLLQDLPQFAYMHGRSAQDALDRAMAHCSHARAVLRTQSNNPHLRKQGYRTMPCRGALTLSVDLQKAFDVMPREFLNEALLKAEVEPALRWAILQIHNHATMRFKIGDHCRCITTDNGIRQGCGLSPTLWSMFTCVVMHHLFEKIHREDTTAFADDWLFQWFIDSESDLDVVITKVAFVLQTLASFGMKISTDKTVVLLSLKGSKAAKALHKYVSVLEGRGKCLSVPIDDRTVRLPVVTQHTYLGVKLSYAIPEQLTLTHRVKQSWANFNRLLPTLRSSSITQSQKVQIWRACVYSTLMYGLDSTGLNAQGPDKLLKLVARQLRIITKAPVHLSREPAVSLLQRLQVAIPAHDLAQRLLKRVTACREGSMQHLQSSRTQQRWAVLEQHAQQLTAPLHTQQTEPTLHAESSSVRLIEVQPVDRMVSCDVCGQYFLSLKALRIHAAQKHKVGALAKKETARRRTQQSMRAEYMKFASEGLPTCSLCGWQFTSWPSFCQHFAKQRCPVQQAERSSTIQPDQIPDIVNAPNTNVALHPAPTRSADDALAEPLPDTTTTAEHAESDSLEQLRSRIDPEQVSLLQNSGWQALAKFVRNTDLHVCPFCLQWLANPHYLTRHISVQHKALHPIIQKLPSWLKDRRATVHSPCTWCHTDFKAQNASRARHAGSCVTLTRVGIISLLSSWQEPSLLPDGRVLAIDSGRACQRASSSRYAEGHDGLAEPRESRPGGPDTPPAAAGDDGYAEQGRQAGQGGWQRGGDRGQWQRQGDKVAAPGSGERRSILQWLGLPRKQPELVEAGPGAARSGQLRPQGAMPGPVEVGSSPRRPTEHLPQRDRIRHVYANQGDALGAAGPLQGQRDLAPCKGAAAGDSHAATQDSNAAPSAGTLVQQNGDGGPVGGGHRECPGASDSERGRQSAVPSVQCQGEEAGDQARQGANGSGGSQDNAQGALLPGTAAPHSSQVSCHEEIGEGSPRRHPPNGAGNWDENSRCGPCLETLPTPIPLRRLQSHGHVTATGQARAERPSQQCAEDDRKHVRHLRLGNSSNYCYSNAAFLSLLWTNASLLGPAAVATEASEHSGLLGPALSRLWARIKHSRNVLHLWQLIQWRTMHTGWRSPAQQHDIVEYLVFLGPQLQPDVVLSRWESRQACDNAFRVIDSGIVWPLWIPAPLHSLPANPNGAVEVQQLVDAWQHQSGLQGLTTRPSTLLIQANRFGTENSEHSKSSVQIVPNMRIFVPVFVAGADQPNALEQDFAQYSCSAVLLHEGPARHTGHYRCILHQENLSAITDDNKAASRLSDLQYKAHTHNTYAFLYVLCPSP